MNIAENLELLKQLRLNGMSKSYEAISVMPVNKQPDGHELIATLLHAEIQHRQFQRTEMLLRMGKLRYHATMEQIICSEQRNLTKQQIAGLADCSFIIRSENILITGATGCGKSYLACALGNQACLKGYRTLYLNMNRFCERLVLSKLDGTYIKLLNQLEKVDLLILDDFGLQPLENNVKLALLQILEDRYQKKSTVISSQLPVSKWHEYIKEPTIADAMMDRITANAHKLELKGESLRKRINKI